MNKLSIILLILLNKIYLCFINLFNTNFKTKEDHLTDLEKIKSDMNVFIKSNNINKKLVIKRSDSESHCTRRQTYKLNSFQLDISKMNKIIKINTDDEYILCEPLCTFEQIVDELIIYGYAPLVCPEFKNITIGGTIAGGGLESSSFKYGLIENTIIEYEILCGDGIIKTLNKDINTDLFYGNMWCLGTLGTILTIKMKIKKCTPYIKLLITYYDNYEIFNEKFTKLIKSNYIDYIECLCLSQNKYCIITGNQITNINGYNKINLKNYWSKWFISHIYDKNQTTTYIIDIKDYLFRWDRGIFWLGLDKINPTFMNRILFGWLFDMQTHHTISRYTTSDKRNEQKRILADLGPPLSKLKQMIDYNDDNTYIYPLWLLPVKTIHDQNKIFSPDSIIKEDFYIDFGIYGIPKKDINLSNDFLEINRKLENKVHELNGMKGFETVCYYSEKEFNTYYNVQKYNELKVKYNGNIYPHIYNKIKYYEQ